MTFSILTEHDVDAKMELQVQGLFKQLNASLSPLSLQLVLQQASPITAIGCTVGDTLAGMGLMAEYSTVSGHKGWIEDVVVDQEYRGKGIGRKLMEELIAVGKQKGLTDILLFTGYHREAANALYQNLGFQKKESQIYILRL
ncbi:MAG: GNAT family N-acetyltransferase [Bacteroidota bacterium]